MYNCKLFGLKTKEELIKILDITEEFYFHAINNPYNMYFVGKNGKKRKINEPKDELKLILRKLLLFLQEIELPTYYVCGGKGQNNIQNARNHCNKNFRLNLDIANFFPSTKTKYVKKFFMKNLKIEGEALKELLKMTTINGYLPTGSPTSPILAFFAHKELFDEIYRKMTENSIKMTLYIDDFTFSANKNINKKYIDYCSKTLAMHNLKLNFSKIKRFGYKNAFVTGVYINQSRKIDIPFCKNYAVIEKLREKNIEDMTLTELQKLLGKISYVQQFHPKRYNASRKKIIERIKKICHNKN